MEGPAENNEAPLSPISQDFLDRWDAKGKSKEIFEPPQVSRGRHGKSMSAEPWRKTKPSDMKGSWQNRHTTYTVVALSRRVSLDKVPPKSVTEEMLYEDVNIPMSEEEEDRCEDTDHHLGTDNPTIHVHGGEATLKADDDDEEGVICLL